MVSFFRSSSSAKTTESIGGSKAMATQVSNWHDAVTLSNQTYATPRALGDYSFYGYNLGVLRTNNRPGYLVETWFHDYRPEALRMKSNTYNKFLAWQIVRAAPGPCGEKFRDGQHILLVKGFAALGEVTAYSVIDGLGDVVNQQRQIGTAAEGYAGIRHFPASSAVLWHFS